MTVFTGTGAEFAERRDTTGRTQAGNDNSCNAIPELTVRHEIGTGEHEGEYPHPVRGSRDSGNVRWSGTRAFARPSPDHARGRSDCPASIVTRRRGLCLSKRR